MPTANHLDADPARPAARAPLALAPPVPPAEPALLAAPPAAPEAIDDVDVLVDLAAVDLEDGVITTELRVPLGYDATD